MTDLDAGPPRDVEAFFLGEVIEVDLAPWAHGGLPRHPEGLVSLAYAPPVHEHRNRRGDITQPARDAHVRLCGPLGGVRLITDPDDLVAEALRLLDAAVTLAAMQRAYPPRQTTQEELPVP